MIIEGYKIFIDFHGLTTYPGFKELVCQLSTGNEVLVWSRSGRASWVYDGLRQQGYNQRPSSARDRIIQQIKIPEIRVVLEQRMASPLRVVAADTLNFFDKASSGFLKYGNFLRWERSVLKNFSSQTSDFVNLFENWKDDIERRGFYKDPRIFGEKSVLIESDGARAWGGRYVRDSHPLRELEVDGLDVIVVPEKETLEDLYGKGQAESYYQSTIGCIRNNLKLLPRVPMVKADIAQDLGLLK